MLQLRRLVAVIVGLAIGSAALAGPAVLWSNGPNVKPTSSSAQIYNNSGTAALPSYAFGSQTTTGLSLPSASNLAMSVAGTQHFNLDSAGVFKFGSPTAGSRLSAKCLSATDLTCASIEYSGGTYKSYWAVGSNYFALWDGSAYYLLGQSGNLGVGNTAPLWALDVNLSNANTNPATIVKNDGSAAVAAHNYNTTAGNLSSFVSTNANDQPDALWVGVHDTHSNTVWNGHWEAWTAVSGVNSRRVTISASGIDDYANLRVRGLNVAGLVQSDFSGNITTTALGAGQVYIGVTNSAPVAATLTAGAGISINSGSGGITISASGTPAANLLTKTTDYSLSATDNVVLFNCSTNCTATLESAAVAGSGATHIIKRTGTAAVLIGTTSNQTIDGQSASAWDLTDPSAWVGVISDGSNWNVIQ